MKLSGFPRLALLFALLLLSQKALAQAPPSGGGAYLDSSTNWDFFLGASYARALSNGFKGNAEGWDATLSEFPYESLSWLGGTVDVGGYYTSASGTNSQYYSVLGGPVAAIRTARIQPFGRFMLGVVHPSSSGSSTGATYTGLPYVAGGAKSAASASTTLPAAQENRFALDAGGGIDYPITPRCAARIQADWTPFWVNSARRDIVRASIGLDFRF